MLPLQIAISSGVSAGGAETWLLFSGFSWPNARNHFGSYGHWESDTVRDV